jgi:hypothetical protein
VIVAAPVLAGRLLRDRARLARALHAAASEEDAEPWAAQAVAQERSRIAAELHDVVARALRRMVVDADGAAALVDAEPGRAPLAFAAVEQTGRDALAEIRRLRPTAFGGVCPRVLRREDDDLARSHRSRRSLTSPTWLAARAPPACRWRCTSRARRRRSRRAPT